LVIEIIGFILLQFSKSKWRRRSPTIILSVLFITALAFIASRDYSTNHSVRDVISFNFSDYLYEFTLFGEPHIDNKEEASEKIIDMAPFIEDFQNLDYSYDYTYDVKDERNCNYNNLKYSGIRVTHPDLSWDQNYRLEEQAGEDSCLIDEVHEKLDACLEENNYLEDEYYYIAHPKNIKKYPEEDGEDLIIEIEDFLIPSQEVAVDNIGAEKNGLVKDDIIDDDDVIVNDYDLLSPVIHEDILENKREEVSIQESVNEEIADVILESDDVLIDFNESSPTEELSAEHNDGELSQVVEILPDPLQPDDPKLHDNKTTVEIDEQRHTVEDQPYTTVQEFINQFGSYLPEWELKEVMGYDKIYYPGSVSIYQDHTESFEHSNGYANGTYKLLVGDQIAYRYEVLGLLGTGGFGIVAEVIDHAVPEDDEHRKVALKVFHKSIAGENENIFRIESFFADVIQSNVENPDRYAKSLDTFDWRGRRCCTQEILGEAIREPGRVDKEFSMSTIRKYAYDILMALKGISDIGVVHGDLKPQNCLFKPGTNESSDIHVVLADWSCSCEMKPPGSTSVPCKLLQGQDFQPLYYRAPEILMGVEFDTKVDMWGLGIIITELFKGIVPFYGMDDVQMLGVLIQTFGSFPPEMIIATPKLDHYTNAFDSLNIPVVPKQFPLSTRLFDVPDLLYDLISKVLVINPKERLTAEEALQHPFFHEEL